MEVNSGEIGKIDKYKLLGFWINEKGNCVLQIEKKGAKVEGKTSAITSLATPNTLGSEYINVRIILFELRERARAHYLHIYVI